MSEFGTESRKVNNVVTLSCISSDARDLLDTIMQEWKKHIIDAERIMPDYEPSIYGFAYWLVRYSNLIRPSNTNMDEVSND